MPTVFRWRGWRFHFYADEGNEPPHIHIVKGRKDVKFWLDASISLARNKHDRATERDIKQLQDVIRERKKSLEKAWREFHG